MGEHAPQSKPVTSNVRQGMGQSGNSAVAPAPFGAVPQRVTLAPVTLSSQELLHLQSTVGNRAVVQLLRQREQPDIAPQHETRAEERSAASPRTSSTLAHTRCASTPLDLTPTPAFTGLVQRKKDTKPPYAKLARLNHGSVGRDKADEGEKGDAIWEAYQKTFEDSRAKGARVWRSLQASIAQFYGEPETLKSTLGAKRAEYDKRYAEHYESQVDTKKQIVKSKGIVDKRAGSAGETMYNNRFDLDTGTIIAASNFANKDKARLHDEANVGKEGYKAIGLPNSEMLWKQYHEMAKSQHTFNKEKHAKKAMEKISKIVRENVQNATTRQVVFVAYPNDRDWEQETMTWLPGSEEFEAILGTPNVAATAFMLIDHMDEFGKKISSIVTTEDRNIEVNFKSLRRLDQKEIELDDLSE